MSIREFIGHLPPAQRELLAAPLRWVPAERRYGPVHTATRREIRKARTVPSWARAARSERLRDTFATARRSRFYAQPQYAPLARALSGEISPEEALRQVPILYREDIVGHHREMLTTDLSEVDEAHTSGTSGQPLSFYLDKNRGAREWAYVADAWAPTGYRLGDWRASLRGFTTLFPGGRSFMVMRATGEVAIRAQDIFPETVEHLWAQVVRQRAHHLHGYPSALQRLAGLLRDASFDTSWRHEIRGIMPVSEEFTQTQKDLLRTVFPQAKTVAFYGLSEKTAFAAEQPDGTYLSYPLYGAVELLDEDGEPVAKGDRGRIVTTSLDGRAMPMIRYDTGDSARYLATEADGSVRFEDITSRRARTGLIGSDGQIIPLTSLAPTTPSHRHIHRYALRQEIPGRGVLLVEPAPGATEDQVSRFRDGLVEPVADRFTMDLEIVPVIEPTAAGKFKILDQRIPDAPTTWA